MDIQGRQGRGRLQAGERSGHDRLDRSIEDVIVWVDNIHGDDRSELGSDHEPFFSVDRAYELCPKVIAHDYQIRLKKTGKVYDGCPSCVDPVIEETGQFAIVGLGDAVVKDPAIACTTVTTAVSAQGTTRHFLNTAPATFTANQWDGYFARITADADPNAVGMVYPIVNTETDSVEFRVEGAFPPHDGCTFEIIEPAVTIEQDCVALTVNDEGSRAPRFVFSNLKFVAPYDIRFNDDWVEIGGNGRTVGARFSFVMFEKEAPPI
jgi:hypothetical protein